ncbi:MAG: ABC transporter permease [bacterium]|jgi:ABC-type transport system involved in multi-copper enzyme maturation permease subunit
MKVLAISINTFKEAVRDRILYTLLIFALFMIGSSALLASLSTGQDAKIIQDLGLSCISIFGTLIAVFLGIGLVYKEIEKRTLYVLISKPIHRAQFILGKYLGLALVLLTNVAIMGTGLLLLSRIYLGEWPWRLLVALAFTLLELLVITGLAILFSSFTTPTLSAIFTLSLFLIGHLSPDLRLFAGRFGRPAARLLIELFYYLLPNFRHFHFESLIINGFLPDGIVLFQSACYGLLYGAALLLLAMLAFARRDLK